jgi:hypothetical protein
MGRPLVSPVYIENVGGLSHLSGVIILNRVLPIDRRQLAAELFLQLQPRREIRPWPLFGGLLLF